jgi:hypothetical protein
MYILNDIARATQNEKQRTAARAQSRGHGYAAGRPGNRSGSAARLASLRIPRVLRERRAAQAC